MENKQNKEKLILNTHKILLIVLVSGGLLLGAFYPANAVAVETAFLYNLSNFSGPVKSNSAKLSFDEERNEIYVADFHENDISVFNDSGMEVYRFGDDGSLGNFVDVDVDEDGNILVPPKKRLKPSILICNFRGEPISSLEIKDLPSSFSGFEPDRMAYRKGRIYLLDSRSMEIAVTNAKGFFEKGYDLASLVGVKEERRGKTDISGFSLDSEGNMLFTISVLFSAYKLTPDGKLISFGKPGGAPGRFGLVGGIVADDQGNIYVADRLKCAILIFNKNFQFQTEFGYRGLSPENLIGPNDIALDGRGRLYVSQLRNRGVSVFKITYP